MRKIISSFLMAVLLLFACLFYFPASTLAATADYTLTAGSTRTIYAQVTGNITDGTWTSSDTGKVKIISQDSAARSCTIQAVTKTSSNVYLEYRYTLKNPQTGLSSTQMKGFYIAVTAPLPAAVSLSPDSLSMKVGDTAALTPTVTPADAETAYRYSSDNEAVAVVDRTSGRVTAVSPGTAIITVRTYLEGKTASCTVQVSAPPSAGEPGEPTPPDQPATPEDSSFFPKVTFPANHAANVSVTETIRFLYDKDIVKGDSFSGITLMDNTSGTATDFTSDILGSVLVLTPVSDLKAGHSYTAALPAGALKTVVDNHVSTVTILSFTTGADSDIPSADNEDPDRNDDTSHTDSDKNDDTDHTDSDKNDNTEDIRVRKLSIQTPSGKIAAGRSVALKATVSPKNATITKVKWKSDKPKYASVNSKGVVTTKKAGAGKTVTITATATDGSGKKASVKIKIMKHAVTRIQIKNAPKTLKAGKNVRLRITVRTNGKNANKAVKWTTSNSKYAVVDANGKVKTKKAGKGKTVKITAFSTDGTNKKAVVRIKLK